MLKSAKFYYIMFCILTCVPVFSQTFIKTLPNENIKWPLSVIESFMSNLEKDTALAGLEKLFEVFHIGQSAKDAFAADLGNLKVKLGIPTGHSFIGFKSFGKSDHYYILYFFSYYNRMPVAWEFTFYRPVTGGAWQLNYIRFESDDIADFLSFPKLQFEAYRKLANDASPAPAADKKTTK